MQPTVEDAVREHLAKVLASPEFQNSDRLCRFLRFIVDARLRGEHDQLKEYLIGKEVFDRDDSYDPRIDPIVRVEARRLRKKLEAYYAGPGAAASLRIDLPKGAYVPEIQEQTAAAGPAPTAVVRGPRTWLKFAFGVVLVGAAIAAAYALWPHPSPGQVVAVVPARWIWTGDDFPDIRHDEDLAERIAAALAASGSKGVQVVAWPSIQRYRGTVTSTRQMASDLGATRIIIVAVRVESDGLRVTAYMIDAKQDRKLHVSDKRGLALDTPANRAQAAAQLAGTFLKALE